MLQIDYPEVHQGVRGGGNVRIPGMERGVNMNVFDDAVSETPCIFFHYFWWDIGKIINLLRSTSYFGCFDLHNESVIIIYVGTYIRTSVWQNYFF